MLSYYTRCCLPAASDSTRSAGTAFFGKKGPFGSDGRSADDDDHDHDYDNDDDFTTLIS